MLYRLILLFTVVPLVELGLLIELSKLTTLYTTISIVILTGIIGAFLARREGLKTWFRIQENISRGASPAEEMLNGLLILIAGAVLITPGLLTDALGFALLISPIRKWFKKKLASHYQKRIQIIASNPFTQTTNYEVIDMPEDPHDQVGK